MPNIVFEFHEYERHFMLTIQNIITNIDLTTRLSQVSGGCFSMPLMTMPTNYQGSVYGEDAIA